MAEIIVYLTFSFLVSFIFVIIGIKQYNSKTPVTINTGLTPPSEEELTSVSKWNHRHGRDFILLGCALFVTLATYVYFLEKSDNIKAHSIIFVIVVFVEIALVVIDHNLMSKKMKKSKSVTDEEAPAKGGCEYF